MKASILVGAVVTLAQRATSNTLAPSSTIIARESSCGASMQDCNPLGASSDKLPALGPELSGLYLALLDSVKGINFKRSRDPLYRTDIAERRRLSGRDDSDVNTPSFCCAEGTTCLLLSTFNVPFCYDKFTTNYVFPDGSSGTIHTGTFAAADGATADLFVGNYTRASVTTAATTSTPSTGNLYSSDPASKPDTATLSIPPQYTAAGVGSAIPLTELGTVVAVSTSATEVASASASATSTSSTHQSLGAAMVVATGKGMRKVAATTVAVGLVAVWGLLL